MHPLGRLFCAGVRHRIDGLEMYRRAYGFACRVRHRIDGLENLAILI